jgi:hypothetical protein
MNAVLNAGEDKEGGDDDDDQVKLYFDFSNLTHESYLTIFKLNFHQILINGRKAYSFFQSKIMSVV